jgi:predicted dehydrogenase
MQEERTMDSRRDFLKASAGALAVAATTPLFGFQGANNRVRMGVIGMGGRSARVFDSLTRNPDCQFTVGCEVVQAKLRNFQSANRPLAQIPIVGDYRRVLDRNDIDAVLIATPDFSHSKILVDALAAGKDVYVEKPISNSIPRINAMLNAYTKTNKVVQVGTHQRSWDHFIEAKKIMDSGVLGNVTHVVLQQGGNYAAAKQDPVPVPPGVDWEAWEVDAPRKPFKQGYLGFRGWWEYGSGLVGDWGAHHVDVANWFMNADQKQPIQTAATGFMSRANIDPECVFDTFSISWQFDTHIVTFENSEIPRPADDIEGWGVYFLGSNGTLQVNRMGYAVRPFVGKTQRKVGAAPPPGAGNVQGVMGQGAQAAPPGAGGRRGGGAAGGGRRGGGPPVTMNVYLNPRGGVEEDYPLDVHTRNFLDCIKSRQKPNAPLEVGYNSALPCLLALESMKTRKILGWDPAAKTSTVL